MALVLSAGRQMSLSLGDLFPSLSRYFQCQLEDLLDLPILPSVMVAIRNGFPTIQDAPSGA
jgi:hypothetical protein